MEKTMKAILDGSHSEYVKKVSNLNIYNAVNEIPERIQIILDREEEGKVIVVGGN